MVNAEDYSVQVLGLKNGHQEMRFKLGDSFFEAFEGDEINGGDVDAVVEIEKSGVQSDFRVSVSGVVKTVCDRCLEPLDVEIENSEEFAVRVGETACMDDDELVVLSEQDAVLDLSSRLFEMCVVALPTVRVHEEGKCNEEMVRILEAHAPNSGNEENTSDPRWDALKNISTK